MSFTTRLTQKLFPAGSSDLALVMTGGGARAAYQVGFLKCLANMFPELKVPIITGMSTGAINAAFLANHPGNFQEAINDLSETWNRITPEKIFRVDSFSLIGNLMRWGFHLVAGRFSRPSAVKSLVDTRPLNRFLCECYHANGGRLSGIEKNLKRGSLKAAAITSTSYMTGQTVTWTQGCDLKNWERLNQVSRKTHLTVAHIMASASIPFFFPAVEVENEWHGDGSIRLYSPLSPAIHLGAEKILAISTRYRRDAAEASRPAISEYPALAQIAGVLMNTVFLDLLDQDADRLVRTNRLLERMPGRKRNGYRPIKLFILRPSVDLSQIAPKFEPKLPYLFRTLMRSQGASQSKSPDWLSMIMFQNDYLRELIRLGEQDAQNQREEIGRFLNGDD